MNRGRKCRVPRDADMRHSMSESNNGRHGDLEAKGPAPRDPSPRRSKPSEIGGDLVQILALRSIRRAGGRVQRLVRCIKHPLNLSSDVHDRIRYQPKQTDLDHFELARLTLF